MKPGRIVPDGRLHVKFNRKGLHESDSDLAKDEKASNYFKQYGKRAGRRLERRTGKSPAICRSPKRLP